MGDRTRKVILIAVALCALGAAVLSATPFICYGVCTGCTCYSEGGEVTECCGWCNWSGPGGKVWCCYPQTCRAVPQR